MSVKLALKGDGTFHIKNVDHMSQTYFPLCNYQSLKSSITPSLSGDMNIDQNSFLLLPTSVEDLENSLMKRHVFFRINDSFTWSINGQTPYQLLNKDTVDLHGEFLIHHIKRENDLFTCDIESFVPMNKQFQELHKITIKNKHQDPLKLKSVVGIPIYGRSAENIRDHRHVTSLLNRIHIKENGIVNHPTFSFDERGHLLNDYKYGVFTHTTHHSRVKNYFPTLEEFSGESSNLLDPLAVKQEISTAYKPGDQVDGYEAIAGLEYDSITLKENESFSMVISLAIDKRDDVMESISKTDLKAYEALKKETKDFWKKELSTLTFTFSNETLNGWLKWVSLQPTLRRVYGNSFMPHHDYGRGGKGWRDLWQDLLALILTKPGDVRALLINNFNGVRIDGSNATIIGDQVGEFLADRNHITRIWMDHGAWPLLTTKLYIDQMGDIDLLFEEVGYFQDQFTHYTKQTNSKLLNKENSLKTTSFNPYKGSVLEHLIIQNLVPYYNVGAHNNLRIEDADWNDGLDMAKEKGESVAFTSFYGQNLIELGELLEKLHAKGYESVKVFKEMEILLNAIDANDVGAKHQRLTTYFDSVSETFSGERIELSSLKLAKTLKEKGQDLLKQVRHNEWMEKGEDGWFNGYYDNDSNALEDIEKKHMTLTGQVFSIMSGAATNKQVKTIIGSADRYLYNPELGGYLLNTDFKEVKTNMGRLFGFAYGHKENGAMFSHMALMYANALYKRGFVEAGYKVIRSIYEHSLDINHSKMYPGIPEYFNRRGRGMYAYLTGSASWMVLTMVCEVFGIKSDFGYAKFEPKLLKEQFENQDNLSIETLLNGKKVTITYHNPHHLSFGEYQVEDVLENNQPIAFVKTDYGVKLKQKITENSITVILNKKV